MHASGLLTKAAHEKITMRHAGILPAVTAAFTGKEIIPAFKEIDR
jgi:hypothetical protein